MGDRLVTTGGRNSQLVCEGSQRTSFARQRKPFFLHCWKKPVSEYSGGKFAALGL